MDNVKGFAQYWNEKMILANKFAGFDDGKGFRTERYVHDIQISGKSIDMAKLAFPFMSQLAGPILVTQ